MKFSIITVNADGADEIFRLHEDCREEMGNNSVNVTEFRSMLEKHDPDEANFFVYSGGQTVAWLKLNGLQGSGTAWVSELCVAKTFRRQGTGTAALEFAENYVRDRGFDILALRTGLDNAAAQDLYKKSGFVVADRGNSILMIKQFC